MRGRNVMAKDFESFKNENFEKLDLYTTAIIRAHGEHHPEFTDIRQSFEKIQAADANEDLTGEFENLKEFTNDYQAPADTCETVAATFELLEQADKLYTNA